MAENGKPLIQSSVPDTIATELYRKMLGVYFIEERLKITITESIMTFSLNDFIKNRTNDIL